jgi:uncharacterized protein YqhQ
MTWQPMQTEAETGDLMSDQLHSSGKTAITNKELLQYGGQAVIEGVMMRSPRYYAVACRKPNGEIVVQREAVDKTIIAKFKWLNWPFGRGTLALIDAMALGTRALRFAANVQVQAIAEPQAIGSATESNVAAAPQPPVSRVKLAEEEVLATAASGVNGAPAVVPTTMPKSGKINDIAIGGTLIFSLVAAIVLFKFIPTVATDWLQHHVFSHAASTGGKPVDGNAHVLNAVDGLIRMLIFFGYILAISRVDGIHRVFMYHGAEHKAINTLEAGLPLTRENALRASRIHPRCGTSFIFIVLLIDLLVIAALPWRPKLLPRFLLQVAITPVVAGIAYETIKFAGKFRRNPLVMAAFAPGMATQYLTTRPPDADQTDVALAALYSVLEAEGHHMRPDTAPTMDGQPNKAEPEAVTA